MSAPATARARARERALRDAEVVLTRVAARDGGGPSRRVRLRPLSTAALLAIAIALMAVLPAASGAALSGAGVGVLGFLVPVAFVLGVAWALFSWYRRAILTNNRAHDALLAGDLEGAASTSRALISRAVVPEQVLGYGLYRIGVASLRRGDHADAQTFLRAGLEVERKRGAAAGAGLALVCAAEEALAVASAGDVTRAQATLEEALADPATTRDASLLGRALVARSRAVLALRSNAPERALELLAADRVLLRNALGADDAALVEATEALARASVAGAAPSAVAVDDETRAYVLRALPEAETALVAEA